MAMCESCGQVFIVGSNNLKCVNCAAGVVTNEDGTPAEEPEEPVDVGGLAFPQPMTVNAEFGRDFSDEYGHGGMTLRDYFAAKAMAEIMNWSADHEQPVPVPGEVARLAYEFADAMIEKRKS